MGCYMAVVSSAFFSLVRARRELERACAEQDWDKVRRWDLQLASYLNQAFDDDVRDTKALMSELQKVLRLYASIVESLPDRTTSQVSPNA